MYFEVLVLSWLMDWYWFKRVLFFCSVCVVVGFRLILDFVWFEMSEGLILFFGLFRLSLGLKKFEILFFKKDGGFVLGLVGVFIVMGILGILLLLCGFLIFVCDFWIFFCLFLIFLSCFFIFFWDFLMLVVELCFFIFIVESFFWRIFLFFFCVKINVIFCLFIVIISFEI